MTRLTNPPQHIFDNDTGIDDYVPGAEAQTAREGAHRQTGDATAPPETDVADPHPSNEEHPYRRFDRRSTVGARGESPTVDTDIGPNPATHDGTPPPRPHNAGSGPE